MACHVDSGSQDLIDAAAKKCGVSNVHVEFDENSAPFSL